MSECCKLAYLLDHVCKSPSYIDSEIWYFDFYAGIYCTRETCTKQAAKRLLFQYISTYQRNCYALALVLYLGNAFDQIHHTFWFRLGNQVIQNQENGPTILASHARNV